MGAKPRSARPNGARTAVKLLPIAGYYGRLVHSQASPGPGGVWGIGPGLRRLPRTLQRVEKVGFELVATTNRVLNGPKAACLVAFGGGPGKRMATKEFFNSLTPSTHSGE
jgi:hypothetical protein